MAPKRTDCIKHVKLKGFVREDGRDHEFYFYVHNGKKTRCFVKFSSSHDVIDNSILKLMIRPLRLDRLQEVKELLECPMSQEALVKILIAKGEIDVDDSPP